MRALVACGADVSVVDENGWTPIFIAAGHGHTETVRALVLEFDNDVKDTDVLSRTTVWIAARGGHTVTVRALVACGADVSPVDENGWTPIFIAASHGHTETVRALVLEFDADVNATDVMSRIPVWIAAQSGDTVTVRALVVPESPGGPVEKEDAKTRHAGTREEPGTLTQGAPVFPGSSRLGIEPKTPGWLVQDPTTSPSGDLIPTIRGSGAHPGRGCVFIVCVFYYCRT